VNSRRAAVLAGVRQQHARAVDAYNTAKPARAYAALRRALVMLDALDDVPDAEVRALTVRVSISLALSESELRGVAAGSALLDDAERLAVQAGDPALIVLVRSQRGALALRGGDLDRALTEYAAARDLIEAAEPPDRCIILVNTGTLHLFRGELTSARAALSEAVAYAHAAGVYLEEAKARHNLGYVEFLAGNLPVALAEIEAATRIAPDLPRGIPLLDRARVLAEAGMVLEADEALAEAGRLFLRDRLAQDLGEVELERARCALIAGNTSAARRFAGRARTRFRRRGNDRWRRSAELVLLQGDLAAGRPGSRLVPPALRLKAEFEKDGLRLPARTAALIAAEAFLTTGDLGSAEEIVTKVGAVGRGDPITARLHARYGEARFAAANGEGRTAARRVRTGLAELAAYQASFGSIDLQTASAVHGSRLAELGLSIALANGRPAAVLAAAERARAVSSRLPAVRPPADAQTAQLLAELRQTVESMREVVPDAAASASLLRRRRELEREITARHWTLAGSGSARPVARIDEIRAAAGSAGTTMVVFVEAVGALHAVVIRNGRLQLHELGNAAAITEQVRRTRADLDVLAQPRLAGALVAAVLSSFRRSAASLDRTLLAPLHVDGQALVLVSTGILGQLPWGTLPSLRGVPVVVAPSATAWLTAAERDGRRRRREVFGLAGPDLSRAEHEVAGIEKAWGTAAVHVGGSAARPALTRAMTRGTVVHIAAHGIHQTENPLFSSLRLADGPLFAHELDQTARTPEHVILSACELGLATVRPGDEALGLTSVLLHLGTRSVVAGVARVGDEIAAETMIGYHERLAAGDDSALALATATSNADSPVPFVCFGSSWRARR
jgi:tetratricopeptide (TPR) repeat protein